MVRLIIGIVAGFLLAVVIITLIEGMGHALWPPPPGPDLTGAQNTKALMLAMPLPALVAVPVGWFLGALGGAFFANLIARRALTGWVVAGTVLAACVYTLFLIPHPWWMVVCGLALPPLAGWIAGRTVRTA